jgi:hypothetical protein
VKRHGIDNYTSITLLPFKEEHLSHSVPILYTDNERSHYRQQVCCTSLQSKWEKSNYIPVLTDMERTVVEYNCEKTFKTVMVNTCTNINKTNNLVSPQVTLNTKKDHNI